MRPRYRPAWEQLESRDLPSMNIVLIVTDDQRFDTLSYMPATNAWFSGGTQFTNGFVTTPVCCPSRSSILTGQFAHNHGVHDNKGKEFFDESTSVAVQLNQEGYLTAFFGKYLNGYNSRKVPEGWDEWHAFRHRSIGTGGGYFDYVLNNNSKFKRYGSRSKAYSTDVLLRQMIQFIEQAETVDDQPFFLLFAPRAPHGRPVPAPRHRGIPVVLPSRPESFLEADVDDKPDWVQDEGIWGVKRQKREARFWEKQIKTLMAVDEAVDTLFQTLVTANEVEQTVFFFVTDNGMLWGEHRLRAKAYPYDEAIRVPFLVRQGLADTPPQLDALVLNIDLAPTILDYAEIPIPTFMDGQSLRPLFGEEPVTWREDFLVEAWGVKRKNLPAYSAVRGLDYLYVRYADETQEYYDLIADPFQMDNVVESPDYADQVQAAQARLDVLLGIEEPE